LGDGLEQRRYSGAGEGLGQSLGQLRPADQLHGVRRKLLAPVKEGAQHIPGGRAASDRCGFVIARIGRERGPHRVLRYVDHAHVCRIAVGDQTSDRQDILAVSLHVDRPPGRLIG
jgi:hypothetical protein